MSTILSGLRTYWRWCVGPSTWWAKPLAWSGLAFAALLIAGSVAGGGKDRDQPQELGAGMTGTAAPPKPVSTPSPGIGQSVTLQKDGWTLTVTSVSKTPTTMFLFQTKTALGVYVVVRLTMENTSKQAQSLGGDRFTILDEQGRTFPYYIDGTIGYGQQELGSKINPGLKAPATILFDVPTNATGLILTSLGGFKVALGNVADISGDAASPLGQPSATQPRPTQPPPTQPAASPPQIVSLSTPLARGQMAIVTVRAQASASCSISYTTPAGTLAEAQGLVSKIADGTGNVSWSWLIGPNTTPGIGTVRVTCGGQTVTASIQIT